ncbi:hypothetical protein ES702_04134 [subsurface metagenome]
MLWYARHTMCLWREAGAVATISVISSGGGNSCAVWSFVLSGLYISSDVLTLLLATFRMGGGGCSGSRGGDDSDYFTSIFIEDLTSPSVES